MSDEIRKLRLLLCVGVIFWTIILSFSIGAFHLKNADISVAMAEKEAITSINKDLALRLWVADVGGLYAPVDKIKPNVYLSHLKEREITSTNGHLFTLMNPAYLLREVMKNYSSKFGAKAHITSTNLLNPENKPNEWELKTLLSLTQKDKNKFKSGITTVNGEKTFHMLYPLTTEKSCLKCHKHQGYSIGDIRGGVGIQIPMKPYIEIRKTSNRYSAFIYFIIWFIGLTIISFCYKTIKRNTVLRIAANKSLTISLEQNKILLKETNHRVKNNLNIIQSLLSLKDVSSITPDQKELIKTIKNRIQIISTLHENLYKHQNYKSHSLSDFIKKISNQLEVAFYTDDNKISITYSFEDIYLHTDQMIPFGLIINEIITNAYKHAFNGGTDNKIFIKTLLSDDGKHIQLTIKDNGKGTPEGFDLMNSDSVGLRVINALVTQLNGKIEHYNDNGSVFTITAPVAPTS
jgi:two-component sensor histidine kinase